MSDPEDEIEGLLLSVEPLMSAGEHALGSYVSKLSERLAQALNSPEILVESQFRRCIVLLATDSNAASNQAGVVFAADNPGGQRTRLMLTLISDWMPEKFEAALLTNLGFGLAYFDKEERRILPIQEMGRALCAAFWGSHHSCAM